MARFVKHFFEWQGDGLIEDQINNYAERNGLKIITYMYENMDTYNNIFKKT